MLNILIVEDNEIDVEAITRALKKANIKCALHRACDGIEALSILRGEDGKTKISQPFLVFLDLNMPRMNGIQFLEEVRSDKQLKQSVVFALTTSNRYDDRLHAYAQNVAGYFLKDNLDTLIKILYFYQEANEFPPNI